MPLLQQSSCGEQEKTKESTHPYLEEGVPQGSGVTQPNRLLPSGHGIPQMHRQLPQQPSLLVAARILAQPLGERRKAARAPREPANAHREGSLQRQKAPVLVPSADLHELIGVRKRERASTILFLLIVNAFNSFVEVSCAEGLFEDTENTNEITTVTTIILYTLKLPTTLRLLHSGNTILPRPEGRRLSHFHHA